MILDLRFTLRLPNTPSPLGKANGAKSQKEDYPAPRSVSTLDSKRILQVQCSGDTLLSSKPLDHTYTSSLNSMQYLSRKKNVRKSGKKVWEATKSQVRHKHYSINID